MQCIHDEHQVHGRVVSREAMLWNKYNKLVFVVIDEARTVGANWNVSTSDLQQSPGYRQQRHSLESAFSQWVTSKQLSLLDIRLSIKHQEAVT